MSVISGRCGLSLTLSIGVGVGVGALALGSSMAMAPSAVAQDDLTDQVAQRCQAQYPSGGGYSQGIPYLAPPGGPNSWRCKQVSLSGGGSITDLPVDIAGITG